jgi:hypothetical protein
MDRATPPYAEWAKRRLARSGMVLCKAVIMSGTAEEDVTVEVREGRKFTTEESFFVAYRHDPNAAAQELSGAIEHDPIGFDAARLLVEVAIREGRAVPEPLRSWAADVVAGKVRRPNARGKIAGATYARDKMICCLIQEILEALSLKPTSANRSEGKSACHAVAEAFALVGLNPDSYEAVVKIWLQTESPLGFDSRED